MAAITSSAVGNPQNSPVAIAPCTTSARATSRHRDPFFATGARYTVRCPSEAPAPIRAGTATVLRAASQGAEEDGPLQGQVLLRGERPSRVTLAEGIDCRMSARSRPSLSVIWASTIRPSRRLQR